MFRYDTEVRKRIVRMHLEEGRTIRSLADEYEVSKASISNWVKDYREECQKDHTTKEDYDVMVENRKLRRQLEEQEKEIRFLKKAAAFFAKEID